MLQREGASLNNGGLEAIAAAVSGMLTLETDPSGASVALTRVPADLDAAGAAIDLGASPIRALTVVTGDYVAAVHREGYEPVDFIFHVALGETLALRRSLVSESWEAEDMVLVEAGSVSGPLASTFAGVEVWAFLIDRYEVSNRIFMDFVAEDGYARDEFWPDSIRIDGELRPWSRAVSTFVDRTGLPGPRSWSGGTFPEGRGDHPVASVSWYEARAFARWAGKELPTMAQWWRAALGDRDRPFPWGGDLMTIDDRSNFGMVGSTPVDQHRFGLSPYGCYDMAGNVREWLQEQAADGRFSVLGGSWQDPTYMFSTPNVERFPPGLANEAVGFRLARPIPER
jgi:formylglycine-generating enzyme required for sulfatase activity